MSDWHIRKIPKGTYGELSKRYNITGARHTISNTGIASPRILIPFIEGSTNLI